MVCEDLDQEQVPEILQILGNPADHGHEEDPGGCRRPALWVENRTLLLVYEECHSEPEAD